MPQHKKKMNKGGTMKTKMNKGGATMMKTQRMYGGAMSKKKK